MVHNPLGNGVMATSDRFSHQLRGEGGYDEKATYALEHLATFKIKNESEIRNPKEKLKLLIELDKTGGIWPQKMFMCFSGPWLLMLDSEMKEIENFPGSLIQEPTAFISEDLQEIFNNILIFTVPGSSKGNTAEMHIFQALDVSAIHLVEDLKLFRTGKQVTLELNKTPLNLLKSQKIKSNGTDHTLIHFDEKDDEQLNLERNTLVLNHCFEDIERFVSRLQYASEAMKELESRQPVRNSRGEGLLILRSRPPMESEFVDMFAKYKLGFNYIAKLQTHFKDPKEPIQNMFTSLHTIVDICNDVHEGTNIAPQVVNPLLRRETINMLSACVGVQENELWKSLGINWTLPKDQFKDHKGSYHPIFYDGWSPDWTVDEAVPYLPPAIKKPIKTNEDTSNGTWLCRLQSRNVKVAQAQYTKTGSNDRELNVSKGEYLEIIDDTKNWWKVRNSAGQVGYVPQTYLSAHNFEQSSIHSGKDSDSFSSTNTEHENAKTYYNSMSTQPTESNAPAMPRSLSMPNVPIPPPPPPPMEGTLLTPSGTLKRNMAAAGAFAAMRARNDCDTDENLMAQNEVTDELKHALMMRERRRDLEILTTPQIYIERQSSPKEVEEWLRGKGFPDQMIKKFRTLSGEQLFALPNETIESYFGHKESSRLISQLLLQKTISGYKTTRSTELQMKLARARQKADTNKIDEIF